MHESASHLKKLVHFVRSYSSLWYYSEDEYIIQHLFSPADRFPRKEWFDLFVTLGVFTVEEWIDIVRDCEVMVYDDTERDLLNESDQDVSTWGYYSQRLPEESRNQFRDAFLEFLQMLRTARSLRLQLPTYDKSTQVNRHLKRGMKLKKIHEVERLAQAVYDEVHENQPLTNICDIGAGQGYVTQTVCEMLHSGTDVPPPHIIALDNDDDQLQGSEKRVDSLSKHESHSHTIQHLNCHLSYHGREFADIYSSLQESDPKMLLMALHACGDLTVGCLNIFASDPHVRTVVSIGCCYHKITEPHAFPLSSVLKHENFSLTSGGLCLACISPPQWTVENSVPQFKQHSFRCALELFLRDHGIHKCNYVGHVRKSQTKSFGTYAVWAVKRMLEKASADKNTKNAALLEELLQQEDLKQRLEKFYNALNPDENHVISSVQVFWCLRAFLAPLLETIILLDRFLFLQEQPSVTEVQMIKIFDEHLSPRNVMFIGRKRGNEEKSELS